ncbi:acyl-CoA desaturase [Leptospira selangorensis]|uniref:fatty acid desaturase n=1 Tax=Leptospira selangorensis TaxID=2484982 RepID=UPI0010841ABF|nr:fatty acid desaturase [Leptospira selangorensis]TGK03704.1 acyl-CoA desaturase [Leptospira selangorensis]
MIYSPEIKTLDPCDGKIVWAPTKSILFIICLTVFLIFGYSTYSPTNTFISFSLTAITLSFGHSVGLHRGILHDSFSSSIHLKRVLLYIAALTGLGGPLSLRYFHDLRDWAQRSKACHPYFCHYDNLFKDFIIQNNCTIKMKEQQTFLYSNDYGKDKFIQFLEKTWLIQQIPIIAILGFMGGLGAIVWGVCGRISICIIGNWLVSHYAHKSGELVRVVPNACTQGYNIPFISLLTMGESLHNNHHAFPESSKFSLQKGELDPGWWCIRFLSLFGWIKTANVAEVSRP